MLPILGKNSLEDAASRTKKKQKQRKLKKEKDWTM